VLALRPRRSQPIPAGPWIGWSATRVPRLPSARTSPSGPPPLRSVGMQRVNPRAFPTRWTPPWREWGCTPTKFSGMPGGDRTASGWWAWLTRDCTRRSPRGLTTMPAGTCTHWTR